MQDKAAEMLLGAADSLEEANNFGMPPMQPLQVEHVNSEIQWQQA